MFIQKVDRAYQIRIFFVVGKNRLLIGFKIVFGIWWNIWLPPQPPPPFLPISPTYAYGIIEIEYGII